MLAQRWEKPSTAQEERRAILRARRLCDDKSGSAKSHDENSDQQDRIADVLTLRQIKEGRSFLATAWIFGVRAELVDMAFESAPKALLSVISSVNNTVATVRKQASCNSTDEENEGLGMVPISLMYRWDPESMDRTCVEASAEFCKNIAGMAPLEFYSKMESNDFPLPCGDLQYLCYFIDGALCMAEGLRSWTRYLSR
jgi:hypothetical protein